MRKIVDWACELFGLKATTHLRDYCNVHMPQLQSSGRHKHYVYIKSLVHYFNEILRLNGVEFHGNKLIVEIVKTPLRTIYSNNTSIESSNLLEALPNIPPFKPSNSTRSNADQPVKQKIRNSYSDAVTPKKNESERYNFQNQGGKNSPKFVSGCEDKTANSLCKTDIR